MCGTEHSRKEKKLLAVVSDPTSLHKGALKNEAAGTNAGDAGRYVGCI